MPLPLGSTIKGVLPQINGNQLDIDGVIGTLVGDVKFKASLVADAAGQLQVISHTLDLPFLARGQRTAIESQIINLNQTLTQQINKTVDPSWEVAGYKIVGDKLAFDFKKKPTP